MEREKLKNFKTDVSRLTTSQERISSKVTETVHAVERQYLMHEVLKNITHQHNTRDLQAEAMLTEKKLNIETGLTQIYANIAAGFTSS